MRIKNTLRLTLCLCLSTLPLQGCALMAIAKAQKHGSEFLFGKSENLTQSTNAATDYTISRARHFANKNVPILVTRPINTDAPALASKLAEQIQDQTINRLRDLGYHAIKNAPKDSVIQWVAITYTPHKTHYALTMTYASERPSNIISTLNYQLEKNKHLRKLAKPIPKIEIINKN